MPARQVVVEIDIGADEYVRVYAGSARDVLATTTDGRTVRFPANILRPFVSHDGVRGRFEISYDSTGRFQNIRRTALN